MNLKNMLKRLTWNYNKDKNSNIYKLFSIFSKEIEDIKSTADKMILWQDLNIAEGKVLDLIGETVGQKRNTMTDEEYRYAIKLRIVLNKSTADINSINTAINSLTQGNLIRVSDGYFTRFNEPASIMVQLKNFNEKHNYKQIKSLVAAGVKLIFEVKQNKEIYIFTSTIMSTGEIITIYPYNVSKINIQKANISVATGFIMSQENIIILPKK